MTVSILDDRVVHTWHWYLQLQLQSHYTREPFCKQPITTSSVSSKFHD